MKTFSTGTSILFIHEDQPEAVLIYDPALSGAHSDGKYQFAQMGPAGQIRRDCGGMAPNLLAAYFRLIHDALEKMSDPGFDTDSMETYFQSTGEHMLRDAVRRARMNP